MAESDNLPEKLKKPMIPEALRAAVVAAKEEGRAQRATLSVAEKMAALEKMRVIAAPIRAARLQAQAAKAKAQAAS